MSVILIKDGGAPGAYALVVDEIPAEQAAQLHTEVTALVFSFKKPVAQEQMLDNAVLENFLRSMVGSINGKIPAIKAIRCLTAWGLKESKDFVESVENRYGISFNLFAQARF